MKMFLLTQKYVEYSIIFAWTSQGDMRKALLVPNNISAIYSYITKKLLLLQPKMKWHIWSSFLHKMTFSSVSIFSSYKMAYFPNMTQWEYFTFYFFYWHSVITIDHFFWKETKFIVRKIVKNFKTWETKLTAILNAAGPNCYFRWVTACPTIIIKIKKF